jgi:hypothetical protein
VLHLGNGAIQSLVMELFLLHDLQTTTETRTQSQGSHQKKHKNKENDGQAFSVTSIGLQLPD